MRILDRLRRRPGTEPVLADPVRPASPAPGPGVRAGHVPTIEPVHLGTWLDVSVHDLAGLADAIDRIYAGTLDGLTIRGVFSSDEVATAVDRTRGYAAEFKDHGEQVMFGTPLVGADEDRRDYFDNAWVINDRLGDLFDDDFVARVAAVLGQVGSGRPARVADEPGRGAYVPATIRFLPPGKGVMHAHTANEFCNAWGAYGHLREVARMWNSLSYFVVGQAASEGGDLVLYDLMWDDTPADVLEHSMSQERDDILARFPTRPIAPSPGDMVLFTGGRIWHRVAPVAGDRERVTIGGFVAVSADDREVLFWS